MTFTALFFILLALGLGLLVGWLLANSRAAAARHAADLRIAELSSQASHADALTAQAEQRRREDAAVLQQMKPMQTAIESLEQRVREADRARVQAETQLQAALKQTHEESQRAATEVSRQAQKLNTALVATNARGFWGESALETLIEGAGLVKGVHFATQVPLRGEGPDGRADMVVTLPGGRRLVVDAKAPLTALLEESDPDHYRDETLTAHATALSKHVDDLVKRRYWEADEDLLDVVVLYLPAENLLGLALQSDPALVTRAAEQRVIFATPTTMLALLRTVEHSWRQERLAASAGEIRDAGAQLYARLATFLGHFDKVGRELTSAVVAYNKGVGSIDTRVMPSARRMHELGVAAKELPQPGSIEEVPRTLSAPEANAVVELPAEAHRAS
jgi:DNA recombination protein RmuC